MKSTCAHITKCMNLSQDKKRYLLIIKPENNKHANVSHDFTVTVLFASLQKLTGCSIITFGFLNQIKQSHALIAQVAERIHGKDEVSSSNLDEGSNKKNNTPNGCCSFYGALNINELETSL